MDSSLISGSSAFHTLTPEKRILNIPYCLDLLYCYYYYRELLPRLLVMNIMKLFENTTAVFNQCISAFYDRLRMNK